MICSPGSIWIRLMIVVPRAWRLAGRHLVGPQAVDLALVGEEEDVAGGWWRRRGARRRPLPWWSAPITPLPPRPWVR